jgi:hypothetical protein
MESYCRRCQYKDESDIKRCKECKALRKKVITNNTEIKRIIEEELDDLYDTYCKEIYGIGDDYTATRGGGFKLAVIKSNAILDGELKLRQLEIENRIIKYKIKNLINGLG